MIHYNHPEARALIKEAGAEKALIRLFFMDSIPFELTGKNTLVCDSEEDNVIIEMQYATTIDVVNMRFKSEDGEETSDVLSIQYSKITHNISIAYDDENADQDAKNLLVCLRSVVEDTFDYRNYRTIIDLVDDVEDRSWEYVYDNEEEFEELEGPKPWFES